MPRQRKRVVRTVNFTEHVLNDAAEMYTFDADHAFWNSSIDEPMPEVEGCFVRLYPPAGLTPEQISTFKAVLQTGGASAVKVMPQPTEAVPDALPALPHRTEVLGIRGVVLARAARTQGVRDQSALKSLLTQCMDKAGL